MSAQQFVSVVIPVFGCASTLSELCDGLVALESDGLRLEIILVDDASTDGGGQVVQSIEHRLAQCFSILLPRNFGQHWATSQGIAQSSGDAVVVMDCDLENSPEDVPKLLSELSGATPCVLGSSSAKGTRSLLRRSLRKIYGVMLSKCYGNDLAGLGFNSFSFAAFNGQFIRDIVRQNSPYDPLSIKVLDSGVLIKSVRVEALQSGRRSSYSLFENALLAFKSVVLAGKGFQVLCVRGLTWLAVTLVGTMFAIPLTYSLHVKYLIPVVLGLFAFLLAVVGQVIFLSLLASIVLSSLNQTRLGEFSALSHPSKHAK